jgi:hypothetical protein
MILDIFTPGSTVFLVFPFDNLFNLKITGIVLVPVPPALKGIPDHTGKVDDPESPAPDVNYRVPAFQGFLPGNPGGGTVKMNRLAGGFIGYGGGYIFDRLTAIRTDGMGDRFGGGLGGLPLGTIIERQIMLRITKQKTRHFIKAFLGGSPFGPFPGGNIRRAVPPRFIRTGPLAGFPCLTLPGPLG